MGYFLFTKIYPYVTIHSGQFSPDKEAVLVNSIPDYIQIRKLILATDADKQLKKANQAQKQADYEMKKAQDDQRKQAILDKLGITNEEAKLIIG